MESVLSNCPAGCVVVFCFSEKILMEDPKKGIVWFPQLHAKRACEIHGKVEDGPNKMRHPIIFFLCFDSVFASLTNAHNGQSLSQCEYVCGQMLLAKKKEK